MQQFSDGTFPWESPDQGAAFSLFILDFRRSGLPAPDSSGGMRFLTLELIQTNFFQFLLKKTLGLLIAGCCENATKK